MKILFKLFLPFLLLLLNGKALAEYQEIPWYVYNEGPDFTVTIQTADPSVSSCGFSTEQVKGRHDEKTGHTTLFFTTLPGQYCSFTFKDSSGGYCKFIAGIRCTGSTCEKAGGPFEVTLKESKNYNCGQNPDKGNVIFIKFIEKK